MGTLFKMVLMAVPVLALVFFYVVGQQSKQETQMQHDQAKMEVEWNEWQADWATDPEHKQRYQQRAATAEKELALRAAEKAEKEAKAKKQEAALDKALEDFEKKEKK